MKIAITTCVIEMKCLVLAGQRQVWRLRIAEVVYC
jgi:hypothetical protein